LRNSLRQPHTNVERGDLIRAGHTHRTGRAAEECVRRDRLACSQPADR
jgi:hypothetical protein